MEVLFATSNKHKVSEANEVGRAFNVRFTQLREPYPEIQADALREVAEDGARFVYSKVKKPVMVEDSGLFINSLKGFPGCYSAFVQKTLGNEGVLKLMAGVNERSAQFVSLVAYADSNGIRTFEGAVSGTIAYGSRGGGGFGFDPLFIPAGGEKTFAEDPAFKSRLSHRKISVQKFCEFLTKPV